MLLLLWPLALLSIFPLVFLTSKGEGGAYDAEYRDRLASAVTEAFEGNISVREAARRYHLNHNTVNMHYNRYCAAVAASETPFDLDAADVVTTKGNQHMVFSHAEEKQMEKCILDWHARHNCISVSVVRTYVLDIAAQLYPDKLIVKKWMAEATVGDKWFRGFCKRHPTLSRRIKDQMCNRRKTVTWESIQSLYDTIERLQQKSSLRYTPDRIYNLDETCFMPDGPTGRNLVFAKRGSKHSHSLGGTGRASITIMPCVRADGVVLPPLIITQGTAMRTPSWWGSLRAELAGTSLEHSVAVQQVCFVMLALFPVKTHCPY
jgi:hypothetical protein